MSCILKSTLANFAIVYLQSLTKENELVDVAIIPNLIIRHTDKVDLVHSYMMSIALACMQFNCLGSFIEFRECGLSTSLIQEFLNDHYSRNIYIAYAS